MVQQHKRELELFPGEKHVRGMGPGSTQLTWHEDLCLRLFHWNTSAVRYSSKKTAQKVYPMWFDLLLLVRFRDRHITQ